MCGSCFWKKYCSEWLKLIGDKDEVIHKCSYISKEIIKEVNYGKGV